MTAKEIIDKYIKFFEDKEHKRIANSPLVPENDPTTLFTSSGMQPLVPYLLGEPHPAGKRLVDVQNCFRAVDIDEVGDNRHTTFFRMLGNWSLGDYFKKEEIPWLWKLLTEEFELPKEKLYITVFAGDKNVSFDRESEQIWKDVLEKSFGSNQDQRISKDPSNWWSRSGLPDKMPAGEPGGPDTEVYYRFDELEHKSECKDNPVECECGKFMEIANSVFMQYQKEDDGSLKLLSSPNVDYGGGVERLLAAVENQSDIFKTSLYSEIIEEIEIASNKKYSDVENQPAMRVIADHLKAATYIILNGITPSNKDQGYVLRRLLRRSAMKMHKLGGGLTPSSLATICDRVLIIEEEIDHTINRFSDRDKVMQIVDEEMEKFGKSLDRGLKIFESYEDSQLNALNAFNLYQTYGFPFEISEELFKQKNKTLNRDEFNVIMEAHQALSRSGAEQKFKGGLADHSEKTIMGHTATHLLHRALRDMFGEQLHQTGSNITSERVRFDFNFERKLEDTEITEIEKTVNGKIKENLPVHFEIMPLKQAKQLGAIGLFNDKYAEDVKVYFIADYSKELCGGPHVDFTSEIKQFKIIKQENIGHGQRRLYCVVGE